MHSKFDLPHLFYPVPLSNQIHTILIYLIAQHRDNKGGMKLCDGKEQGGTSVAGHILNAL